MPCGGLATCPGCIRVSFPMALVKAPAHPATLIRFKRQLKDNGWIDNQLLMRLLSSVTTAINEKCTDRAKQ